MTRQETQTQTRRIIEAMPREFLGMAGLNGGLKTGDIIEIPKERSFLLVERVVCPHSADLAEVSLLSKFNSGASLLDSREEIVIIRSQYYFIRPAEVLVPRYGLFNLIHPGTQDYEVLNAQLNDAGIRE